MSQPLIQMERTNPESPEGIGSVKAAISLYGGNLTGRKPDKHITHITLESAMKAGEVAQRIKVPNAKSRTPSPKQISKVKSTIDDQDPDVLHELLVAKEEVTRLKLDIASALEAKTKAHVETESSLARAKTYERSAQELSREIETVDEEQVLVELARIEAERELREIEAQRGAEATQFSTFIELAKNKIDHLRKEIDLTKDLEIKLAATNSVVNAMQNDLEVARAMESSPEKNGAEDDQKTIILLRSVEDELESARKELKSVKEEGYQFMYSMDLVRKELMLIPQETERLYKLEKRANLSVENLNSKLLIAKSKLEHAIVNDERSKAVVSNLSSALKRMEVEAEAARKEKELASKETETIKMEIEKAALDIKSVEEELHASMKDLESVKESEAMAIKRLMHSRERLMRSRASSTLVGSSVTISKSEYEYLRRQAAAAKVVGEKKVAAAQAWVEALKAGEKEILMRCEVTAREIKEIKAVEKKEIYERRTRKEEVGEGEEEAEASNFQLVLASPGKSTRDERMIHGGVRRGKMRRLSAASQGGGYEKHSASFAMKKRTKVISNVGHRQAN